MERDVEQHVERAQQQAEAEIEWWRRQVKGQEEEILRQKNLIYGALIGTGIVMMQPFLTAASLDLAATICVVAFAVAIPILAALVLINRQETFRRRATPSRTARLAEATGQAIALIGVVAGFWHITPIAGIALVISGAVALAVHSAAYVRLERGEEQTPTDGVETRSPDPRDTP